MRGKRSESLSHRVPSGWHWTSKSWGRDRVGLKNLQGSPPSHPQGEDIDKCILSKKSNVWLQKIAISTPRKVIGNSEGEGVSKAKMFKEKYEAKLENPGSGGSTINLPWEGYGYLLEPQY